MFVLFTQGTPWELYKQPPSMMRTPLYVHEIRGWGWLNRFFWLHYHQRPRMEVQRAQVRFEIRHFALLHHPRETGQLW